MDAAYNKETIAVILDPSEVRLIMQALDVLRYSDEPMNGSQLINLAGLSHEWLCVTQDIGSPQKLRISHQHDVQRILDKITKELKK